MNSPGETEAQVNRVKELSGFVAKRLLRHLQERGIREAWEGLKEDLDKFLAKHKMDGI